MVLSEPIWGQQQLVPTPQCWERRFRSNLALAGALWSSFWLVVQTARARDDSACGCVPWGAELRLVCRNCAPSCKNLSSQRGGRGAISVTCHGNHYWCIQHTVQGDRKFTGGWLFTLNPTFSAHRVAFSLVQSEGEAAGCGDAGKVPSQARCAPTPGCSQPSQTQGLLQSLGQACGRGMSARGTDPQARGRLGAYRHARAAYSHRNSQEQSLNTGQAVVTAGSADRQPART